MIIIRHCLFLGGYMLLGWANFVLVRAGIVTPRNAAFEDIGYIIIGAVWLAFVAEKERGRR